ncbi:DNRLRE domain-containing protein [Nonomuraea pusilla]|uniref:DNRLRE domain-containing protein n=1 Tax=Nonomuraea pusilla TaxID=46177 RepID=UPI0033211DE2
MVLITALTLVISLVTVPSASAEAGPARLPARVSSWLATQSSRVAATVAGWFAEEPKGEIRPSDQKITLPGRDSGPTRQRRVAAPPGKRVKELPDKRSRFATVYELEDGRLQAEISSRPAYYQDGKGTWQPIDTRIEATAGDGFTHGNDKAGYGTRFGDKSDKLLQVKAAGRQLTLGVAGDGRQISPKVNGSTVTYPGAWDGADLVYQVTPEGVKEYLVLAKPPAAEVPLTFTVKAGGLRAEARPDGSIAFVGKDGTTAFAIPKPFMFDAQNDPASPYGKRYSDAVTQEVTQQGAEATITLKPDPAWLAAGERKWPVVIDPTIVLQPDWFGAEDTYVSSASKTGNFSEAWQLPVGKTGTGAINRSLINIQVVDALPDDNVMVDDARLEVYFDQALGEAGAVTVGAHEITSGWGASDVTWNTQPTFKATAAATVTRRPGELSRWHAFNVTDVVRGWLSQPFWTNGLMLKAADESTAAPVGGPLYEAASESAYGGDGMGSEKVNTPKLVVTYGVPSVTLKPVTTATSVGASLSWTAYADPTPDDDSDDLVGYELHRTCPSGCQNGGGFTSGHDSLVTTLPANVTSYTDTASGGDPEAVADPSYIHEASYWVEAVLADGRTSPSQEMRVILPRPGEITTVLYGGADTTLASGEPSTGHDQVGGQKRLQVGNTATALANTRAVVAFDDFAARVPADADISQATLSLWGAGATGTGASFTAHKLTKTFDESATWTSPWASAGGDFDATALATVTGVTATPGWRQWTVTDAAKAWLADPAANKGLLVKVGNEAGTAKQSVSFLSGEADEPVLRPRLRVTYKEKAAGSSTFYVPGTPDRLRAGETRQIAVVVTNTTGESWDAARTAVGYHWKLPDGTGISTPDNQLKKQLPNNLAPGESATVYVDVKAPTLDATSTNLAEGVQLVWDVQDTVTNNWKSATHHLPQLPQQIRVDSPTSDLLGLEKFYQYTGLSTGAGSSAAVNLYAGNVTWSHAPISNPSRGIATNVRMTYNSLDTSTASLGYGWSLQTSTLSKLGSQLQFHPPGQKWPDQVRLTDGDGTTHVWTLDPPGKTDCTYTTCAYKHPRGVHLYLQQVDPAGFEGQSNARELAERRAWVFTKPDRTQFFYDTEGFQSAIVDKNGNTMSFTYERRRSNNKPTKFLQYITDAAGRRTLNLSYYKKGQDYSYVNDAGQDVNDTKLTNPHIIDNVESIVDIAGRKLTFAYTDKGLLAKMVDGAGDEQAKTFRFTYDATQGTRNVKLVSVKDPRGNDTKLAYYEAPVDPQDKWKLETITSRRGATTRFDYVDPDGPQEARIHATVTDALTRQTKYELDAYGRPEKVTNAQEEITQLLWDGDHNVERLTEHNGAYKTWTYDQQTGYPLTIKSAEANKNGWPGTTLRYDSYLKGNIADLAEKTSPEGRKWSFHYDLKGNLTKVTDPAGTLTDAPDDYSMRYEYDPLGQVAKAIDANGHDTEFSAYHPSGYPEKTTDAYDRVTTTTYDPRGLIVKTEDANGKISEISYDIFERQLETKVPKDQNAGKFVVTPAPVYDLNDNVVKKTAPNGAVETTVYDKGDLPTDMQMPRYPDGKERKFTTEYDVVGNVVKQTEPLGNLTPDDPDDYTTSYTYTKIYQLDTVTDAEGGKTSYFYDEVGNMVKVVDPRKNNTPDPDDYSIKHVYDWDHRQTSKVDAAGHAVSWEYDKDNKTTAVIDQEGNKTELLLDERGLVKQSKVPHSSTNGEIKYVVTEFRYDPAGNRTKVITPRGVETADDPDDFVEETRYDKLNRVEEQVYPYDKDDPRYNKPDSVKYFYDEVGNLAKVSAPPSSGETVRNDTVSTFYDNGWTRTTTDAWDLTAAYEYNDIGQQTNRTLHASGGSSSRTLTWDYYLDGNLKSHTDDGTPVGKDTVLVDNSDFQNVTTTGATWSPAAAGTGFQGYDYDLAPAGTGQSSLTWNLTMPAGGKYEVFVRYPSGATATDAPYQITHSGGSTQVKVDQTKNAGEWVSLGSYDFSDAAPPVSQVGERNLTSSSAQMVTLTDAANGTVAADAVKLVRDNSGETDTEQKKFEYVYDVNGRLETLTDNSSGRRIDTYDMVWTELGQIKSVTESKGGQVKNVTSYTYNEVGNPTQRRHDGLVTDFTYDVRDAIETVVNQRAVDTTDTQTTTFSYTARGELLRMVAGNGNIVELDYFLDGLARSRTEKKADGTLIASHLVGYQGNGHRASDHVKLQNADNPGSYLEHELSYAYDPRDRVAKVAKQVITGSPLKDETYTHDANNNVIDQTVDGVTTKYDYDRNRLMTATAVGGATSTYNYDPYGRLDTITQAGQQIAKYKYDGFDHVKEYIGGSGLNAKTTRYTYDPMDRTVTRTKNAGTGSEKTTTYEYLGTSDDVVSESEGGAQVKAYYYGAPGQRLSQMKLVNGAREHSFYSFNMRGDVEAITGEGGVVRATYGYTAYGNDDKPLFTGIDKYDAAQPDKEPYNSFRYNNKRYDEASQSYDMGARDYLPGINRFLERDWFNGALDDLDLAADPWTGNRYAFAGGNPITYVEIDGHLFGLSLSDIGHLALDVAGMVPVVGEVADLANAGWYALEGNYVDAALSLAGAVPFAGAAATGVKWVKTAVKISGTAGDVGKAARRVDGAAKLAKAASDRISIIARNGGTAPDILAAVNAAKAAKKSEKAARKALSDAKTPVTKTVTGKRPVKVDQPSGGAKACPVSSFVPGTKVLLANGSRKAIDQLKIGDQVVATDPATGRTAARPVLKTITSKGVKRLVSITVDVDGDQGNETGTVVATDRHPIWVPAYDRWTDAGQLKPGMWLQTSAGTHVQITAIEHEVRHGQRVHNLSIADVHTYYTAAGEADLLVHNTGCVDAAIGEADRASSIRPASVRPAVAEALELPGGQIFTATSSRGAAPTLHPDVQSVLDAIPDHARGLGHGQCGLPQCLSQALNAGMNPAGSSAAAVLVRSSPDHPKHGTPIGPCDSCGVLVDHYDINFLTK